MEQGGDPVRVAAGPKVSNALIGQAVSALQRGDYPAALHVLETAMAGSDDPAIPLFMAAVHRRRGDGAAERAAIQAALVRDPYHLPALLARADLSEREGRLKQAAVEYRYALNAAPARANWPQPLVPPLERASAFVEQHSQAYHEHLQRTLADAHAGLSRSERERWSEAMSIMAGRSRPYRSESNQLHAPRLPAIPFFERELFPWTEALEGQTAVIRAELEAALAAQREAFTPYIAYKPGDPVNQWAELDGSDRWSAYHLWRSGEPVTDHLARCPQTAAALEAAGLARVEGLCPNAMFSALAPGAHIPPHHGETNTRVIVHLPLIVPPGCSYRVGFERREWREGEILVFDDTLEHEARNDGGALRVVLIFDVWNPLLSQGERAMVQALAAAARRFNTDA